MDMCWEVRRELLNGKRSTGSYKRESRMWAGKARDVWTHLSRKIVLADRYHIFSGLMCLKMASTMYIRFADERLNIEKRCGESDSLRLFILSLDGT